MHKKEHFHPHVFGQTTLGERGQVVIPKAARKDLGLKNGQRFLVLVHTDSIVLVPAKTLEKLTKKLTQALKF